MARIEVVEASASWAAEFTVLARALSTALAGLDVGPIEHIGSTAVPGLAAKDVIDVQVTVADLEDPRLAERMEVAGYAWRSDVTRDHLPAGARLEAEELRKRFATQGAGMRRTNIHFRVSGRFNHRYALLCRDYLRTHPTAAAAYGEIKRNLARLFPDDLESYYDVKDPVFDVIMAGAEDWAAQVGWSPASQPM